MTIKILFITVYTLFLIAPASAAQNHLCEFEVEVQEVMRSLSIGINKGQKPIAIVKIKSSKDLGSQDVCARYLDINLFAIKLQNNKTASIFRKGQMVKIEYHFKSKPLNGRALLSTELTVLE